MEILFRIYTYDNNFGIENKSQNLLSRVEFVGSVLIKIYPSNVFRTSLSLEYIQPNRQAAFGRCEY